MDSWEKTRLKVMYGIWDEEEGRCYDGFEEEEEKENDYEKYGY